MSTRRFVGTLVLGLFACTGASARDLPNGAGGRADGGADGGTTGANAAAVSLVFTLESGMRVDVSLERTLSSRARRPGDALRGTVTSDVGDKYGNILIPAGAIVLLSMNETKSGSDQVRSDGQRSVLLTSVSADGVSYSLYGTLDTAVYEGDGRGASGTPVVVTLTRALTFGR